MASHLSLASNDARGHRSRSSRGIRFGSSAMRARRPRLLTLMSALFLEDADDVPLGGQPELAPRSPRAELTDELEVVFRDHVRELVASHVASLADVGRAVLSTSPGMVDYCATARPQHPAYLAHVCVDVGRGDVDEHVERPHAVDAPARDRGQAPPIVDMELHVAGLLEAAPAQFDAPVRKVDQAEAPGDALKGFGPAARSRAYLQDRSFSREVRQHHLCDEGALPFLRRRPFLTPQRPIPPLPVRIVDGAG